MTLAASEAADFLAYSAIDRFELSQTALLLYTRWHASAFGLWYWLFGNTSFFFLLFAFQSAGPTAPGLTKEEGAPKTHTTLLDVACLIAGRPSPGFSDTIRPAVYFKPWTDTSRVREPSLRASHPQKTLFP